MLFQSNRLKDVFVINNVKLCINLPGFSVREINRKQPMSMHITKHLQPRDAGNVRTATKEGTSFRAFSILLSVANSWGPSLLINQDYTQDCLGCWMLWVLTIAPQSIQLVAAME